MKTQYVHPTQLSDSDIRLITEGFLSIKFGDSDPKALFEKALKRELFFYKLTGEDFFGIAAVRMAEDCLWLELITGEGLVKHFDEIHDWLMRVALSCGVNKLGALVSRPGLKRLWERHEARHEASYMVREVSHG